MHARALLLEVARQYHSDDNGRMLLSRAYMAGRGWRSVDMLTKAKAELLEGGFIFQTVMGHRPNKASWYAVTWRTLNRLPGYDAGTLETFERSAYKKQPIKNACLTPPHGTGKALIVPPHGAGVPLSVPPHGTNKVTFDDISVPPHGHPLGLPSGAVCLSGVGAVPAILTTETKVAHFDHGNYKRLTAEPAHLFTNLIH
jgi:hypothetical protein